MKNEELDFAVEHNLNVLFVGRHGVGKTSIAKQTFERHGLRYLYFSGSTMDPWVDFIGVPREHNDNDGKGSFLDIVRPKHFRDDEIEAIIIDEYNRSDPAVQNAVMELIQFKSINGRKFENLRMVWAAINPPGMKDNYNVGNLDPAQLDRFEMSFEVPYKPSLKYFKKKYGHAVAKNAIDWWNALNDTAKDKVSPRRLDYAVQTFIDGGPITAVLPPEANRQKFIEVLKSGDLLNRFVKAHRNGDREKATEILNSIDGWEACREYVKEQKILDDYKDDLNKEIVASATRQKIKPFKARGIEVNPAEMVRENPVQMGDKVRYFEKVNQLCERGYFDNPTQEARRIAEKAVAVASTLQYASLQNAGQATGAMRAKIFGNFARNLASNTTLRSFAENLDDRRRQLFRDLEQYSGKK